MLLLWAQSALVGLSWVFVTGVTVIISCMVIKIIWNRVENWRGR